MSDLRCPACLATFPSPHASECTDVAYTRWLVRCEGSCAASSSTKSSELSAVISMSRQSIGEGRRSRWSPEADTMGSVVPPPARMAGLYRPALPGSREGATIVWPMFSFSP